MVLLNNILKMLVKKSTKYLLLTMTQELLIYYLWQKF